MKNFKLAFDAKLVIQIIVLLIMGAAVIISNNALVSGHLLDTVSHVRMNVDGLPIYVTRTEFDKIKETVDLNNKLLIAIAAKQGIYVGEIK